jgi:hypothetical protein
VVGDGLGGEGARSMRKQGLASVRARAWRASTCSDIVDAVGCGLFAGGALRNLSSSPLVGEYCERGWGRDEGWWGMV